MPWFEDQGVTVWPDPQEGHIVPHLSHLTSFTKHLLRAKEQDWILRGKVHSPLLPVRSPFMRSKSLGPAHTQGEEPSKGVRAGRWASWRAISNLPVIALHTFCNSGVSPGCLLGKEEESHSITCNRNNKSFEENTCIETSILYCW